MPSHLGERESKVSRISGETKGEKVMDKQATILIASSAKPRDTKLFAAQLGAIAPEDFRVQLAGIRFVYGPGCINYGIRVTGEELNIERFANSITMALMPASWEFTNSSVPDGVTDEL
jgi:hypothetical protein